MAKSLQEQLAEAQAALAATRAELAEAQKPKARSTRNIPEFPPVEVKDEAGNITQRQVSCQLISAGGPWYTVVQVGEVIATGERILFLRKYRTITVKEGKAREGETVGEKVLRQASSFRINSAEHWNAIVACGAECFRSATKEASV